MVMPFFACFGAARKKILRNIFNSSPEENTFFIKKGLIFPNGKNKKQTKNGHNTFTSDYPGLSCDVGVFFGYRNRLLHIQQNKSKEYGGKRKQEGGKSA